MRKEGVFGFVALVFFFLAGFASQGALAATRKFELIAKQLDLAIDHGVIFKAMTFNDKLPGPMLVVDEGDTVEITVRNEDKVTHGLSIHAANAQTTLPVANIAAGETERLSFKADFPGVFMYHCAPGGHGIMTHTMAGPTRAFPAGSGELRLAQLGHADKFTFRFTKPGEYEYFCTVHPYMKGRIRVYQ